MLGYPRKKKIHLGLLYTVQYIVITKACLLFLKGAAAAAAFIAEYGLYWTAPG